MKKQSFTYSGKDLSFDGKRIIETDYLIKDVQSYSLSDIEKAKVPNRIRALTQLSNSCNETDSIVKVETVGRIMESTFWFVKSESDSIALGFLHY